MAQEQCPFVVIKYLIFIFLLSFIYYGNANSNHYLEFRHLKRDASRIWRRMRDGSVLIRTEYLKPRLLGSLRLPCYVQDSYLN